MSKRKAPIQNELPENEYVCVETPHKWNFQTLPHYVFILLEHLSSIKQVDAVSLYLYYWNRCFHKRFKKVHCPWNPRIHRELGWNEAKVGRAKKCLVEWNLIYTKRDKVNGMNKEDYVYLKDWEPNFKKWIRKIRRETPESVHFKYLTVEMGITDTCEIECVGKNAKNSKNNSSMINNCNNRESAKSHDTCDFACVNKEQSSLLSRVAKGKKSPLALREKIGFFDREKNDSLSFILKDNSYFYPTPDHLKTLENNFPNLDLKEEFLKIQLWCAAHEDSRKTRRGAKNFINRWMIKADKDRRQYTPSKPTAKTKPIESYYSEAYTQKQARKTVDQLDIQDHQIKALVDNIKGIEIYYESIPKQFKKYSFFYQSHWAIITKYIQWLKEEVRFDNLSPKLIWTGSSMFKKFLEWSKNDTTIRLSIRDGKYA